VTDLLRFWWTRRLWPEVCFARLMQAEIEIHDVATWKGRSLDPIPHDNKGHLECVTTDTLQVERTEQVDESSESSSGERRQSSLFAPSFVQSTIQFAVMNLAKKID
jgi:hypothetical protein